MSARAPSALVLSPSVTFHARGDACFAWHGDTGDVCEMSRDVVALMMAFGGARGAGRGAALARVTSLDAVQAAGFIDVLSERAFLLPVGARLDLGARRPFVSRYTVYERHGADENLKNILDRLILQFQADFPAFTTVYGTARKIVNSGGGHAATPAPPTP